MNKESYRMCCICGESTASIRFLFCKTCYNDWFIPHGAEPWIKFLMSQEQKRFRQYKHSKDNISLDDLEI